MKLPLHPLVSLATASLALGSGIVTQPVSAAAARLDPAHLEFFEKKIRPVLIEKCYDCHSADGKAKGDLELDSREGIRGGGRRGPAIVPGNLDASSLIAAIRYGEGIKMPPPKNGGKLPDEVIADFEKWVKLGAPDPRAEVIKSEPSTKAEKVYDWAKEREFWAFQKPRPVPPPKVVDTKWPRTDVDRFLLAKLEEKKLTPTRDADPRTLLRRVYFDLTGLPPSPAEVEAFAKNSSPRALEAVVDKLLASPQFGERWGRQWLDVARYGESSGKDRNITFPYAWRYRDYVIESFNQDKPLDRFITEQLAGDLLPARSQKERDELLVATGFLAVGPKGLNETRPKWFKWDVVDDQIDTTSRALLGLTVSCARCHDHKFDPIGTRDYHALGGIFASTDTLYGTIGGGGNRRPSTLLALAGAPEYPLQTVRAPAPNVVLPAAVTNQAASATDSTNRAPNTPTEPDSPAAKRAKNAAKRAARAAAQAGTNGVIATNATVAVVATSTNAPVEASTNAVAAANNARARARRPATGTYAMGVREASPVNSPIYFRGDLEKPREIVERGFLRVAAESAPKIPEDASGRLQLAQWIASAENPLTARVFVNRVWQQLFGSGLVRTPDNFGHLGERPTHPELLDYLAVRFVGEQRWSVKALVRSLVLTRAYQLGSEANAQANEVDAQNTLVWRAAPRRLDAESIRDAILAASGRLDLEPPSDGGLTAVIGNGYIGANIKDTEFLVSHQKRALYLPLVRDLVPESLALFDLADPNLVTAKREETSSPAQALFILNNSFVLAESAHFAKRLLEPKAADEQRIRDAYLTVFSRLPSSAEVGQAKEFIAQQTKRFAAANLPKPALAAAAPAATGTGTSDASARATSSEPTGPVNSTPAPRKPVESIPALTPPEAAWASFTQALFASAEFRYLQ